MTPKMRKIRSVGILITILGGIIMLIAMISGIFRFAAGLYEDIYFFPADLSISGKALKTDSFIANAGDKFSLWLKLPDRRTENKNFTINASFVEQRGRTVAEFKEDFNFGYFRNSYGRGQYYRLGIHKFKSDFNGYITYTTSGAWIPPYNGSLVIRLSKSPSFPLKQIGIFLIGIYILLIGIKTIAKNS